MLIATKGKARQNQAIREVCTDVSLRPELFGHPPFYLTQPDGQQG
jgi:hypothetical protein